MENKESLASKFHANRVLLLMIVLMGCFSLGFAQGRGGRNFKMTAEGTVVDSKTAEPLFAATVKAVSADGGTGTFGITDSVGHFSFDVEFPGKYTLEFSYVGYKPLTKEVSIFPGRGAKLGTFKMSEDQTYLKEVETVARNQRVKQVGDTVEYNADAYKVRDGASAEELVAKMPGIEVTNEGIKAQGETVEKVLVDGKSYFENDPKMALKALPAEVVDRVRVFDKKSDQAEFTGFDDGNTVKAMDLKTKAYRRNGTSGKVYGGIGNNFDLDNLYWNLGFNLNIFNGDRRFSLLGMSNNVNQQDFTFDDLQATGGMGGGFGGRMGRRMGGQAGVSKANAFSLNYNDSFLDDKLEIQGSYSFNNTRTVNENESQYDAFPIVTDSIKGTKRYNSSLSESNSLSHNYSHSFNMRLNYKPSDRDEFIFRPSISVQKSDSRSYSESNAWNSSLDSVLNAGLKLGQDLLNVYNYNVNRSTSDNTSWNLNGMLTWRHKFDKAGRTLSSEIRGSLSDSDNSSNNYRIGTNVLSNQNFQNSTNDQKNWSLGGNLQYTEALGETSQLSIRYNVNYNQSDRERYEGYADQDNVTIGYHYNGSLLTSIDSLDGRNSSRYISKNLRQGGEIAYRFRTETVNAMIGLNLESSILKGEQDYFAWDEVALHSKSPNFNTTLNYFSVLPNLRIEWRPWAGGSINLDYRARTSNPSIANLQETINTSNTMRYSTGNKNLEQTTSHSIGLRLIHSNMETATNIMFFGNYSISDGQIGNQIITNYSDHQLPLTEIGWVSKLNNDQKEQYKNLFLGRGASFTRPVNLGGTQSVMGMLSYGFPFDLLYSNVNLSMSGNYSLTPTQVIYYDSYDSKTGKYSIRDFTSKQRNLSLMPRLSITSNISQDLDFSLSYSPSYSKISDKVNKANNFEYFNQTASARLNWTFWKDLTIEQDLNYSYYGGSSMPKVIDELVWNMSFGKKFLKKNAGEIKLQIYDILNSRTGYSRSTSATGITQSYNNFMPRYFMLTFSYKIASYKGSSDLKERRGGFGGGFGPRF